MKTPNNITRAYDVYRPAPNGKNKHIDTVFFTGYTVDEVRRSLINHDGYAYDIVVRVARNRK